MKPQIFGKYCLLDRINVGGMAEVFRARPFNDRGYKGFLALKRILPHLAEDQEFIKMFIDEAKVTTRLHHRNIVRVHELATYKDANFILMEYICGRDVLAIQKAMRRRREICPVDFAAMMMADVMSGLDFAHKATDDEGKLLNIVHRDVSPQNVLIQYDGTAKVIDFGIAKAAFKSTKTRVGVVKGKVGYMSPEQVRSEPLTGQSDIFSVGVVFWELVTNKRLFKGANEFDTMTLVREAQVRPPSTVNPAVPPEIDRIILKALAPELADRYQTGGEMVADLEKWLLNRPTSRSKFARWMQTIFASDVEEERERIERFKGIQTPNDVIEYNRLLNERETKENPSHEVVQPDFRPEERVVEESSHSSIPPTDHANGLTEELSEELLSDSAALLGVASSDLVESGSINPGHPDQPIDQAAYMAFAEERTQIRAGGFSISDVEAEAEDPENPFSSFGFSPEPLEGETSEEIVRRINRVAEDIQPRSRSPFKVLLIGFIILLFASVGVAVAAAFIIRPGDQGDRLLDGKNSSLVINVTPPLGIDVVLDGKPVGSVSPVTVNPVSLGKHVLSIRARGYRSYSELLDIPDVGIVERTIVLDVAKDPRSLLKINAETLGPKARIFVDGEAKSVISASEGFKVQPGEHVIEVTEDGKFPISQIVDVKQGKDETFTPMLFSTKRRLVFPDDTTAEVNNKPIEGNSVVVDTLTPVNIVLRRGTEVVWEGFVGYPDIAREEFDPDKTPQNLTKRDFGWLSVDTGKDWWMLSLDGLPSGLASPISVDQPVPVRKGEHTLDLSRANATATFPLTVAPGGFVSFDRDVLLKTSYLQE